MSSSSTEITTTLISTPLEKKRAQLLELKQQPVPDQKKQLKEYLLFQRKLLALEAEIGVLEAKEKKPATRITTMEELGKGLEGLTLKQSPQARMEREARLKLNKEYDTLVERLQQLGVVPLKLEDETLEQVVVRYRARVKELEQEAAEEKARTSRGTGLKPGATATEILFELEKANKDISRLEEKERQFLESEKTLQERVKTDAARSTETIAKLRSDIKLAEDATDAARRALAEERAAQSQGQPLLKATQDKLADCEARERQLVNDSREAVRLGTVTKDELAQIRTTLEGVQRERTQFEDALRKEKEQHQAANRQNTANNTRIEFLQQKLGQCQQQEGVLKKELETERSKSTSSTSSSSPDLSTQLANTRTQLAKVEKERALYQTALKEKGVDLTKLHDVAKEISKVEHEGTFDVHLGSSKQKIYWSTMLNDNLLPSDYFTKIVKFAPTDVVKTDDTFALKLPRSGVKFVEKMEQLIRPYLSYVYATGYAPVRAWADTIVPVLELIIHALQTLELSDEEDQAISRLVEYMHNLVAWLFVRLSTGRESDRQSAALTGAREQDDAARNSLKRYPFESYPALLARLSANQPKGNNLIGEKESVPTPPLFAMYNEHTNFAAVATQSSTMTVEAIIANTVGSTMIERVFMINLFRRFTGAGVVPKITVASWAKDGPTITRKLVPGLFADDAGTTIVSIPTAYAKIIEKFGVKLDGKEIVDLNLSNIKEPHIRTRIMGQLAQEFLYVLTVADAKLSSVKRTGEKEIDTAPTRKIMNTVVAGVMFTPIRLSAEESVLISLEDSTLISRYGERPMLHDVVGDQSFDYIIRTAGRPTSSAAMTTHADAFSFKTITDIGKNKLSEAIKNPKNNKSAPAQSKWIDAANSPQTGLSGGVTVFDELDDQTLGPFTVLVADNVFWNDAQRKGLFKGHGNPGQIAAYHALIGNIDLDNLPVAYKEYQTLEGSDIQLHAGGASPAGRTLIYINYDGTSHPVEIGARSKQTKNGYWYELFGVAIPPMTEGASMVARASLPDPLTGRLPSATQYQSIPSQQPSTSQTYGRMTSERFLAGLDHVLAEQMAATIVSAACMVKVAPPGTPRPDLALLTETNRVDDLLALAAKTPLLVFIPSPAALARFRDIETRVQRRASADIVAALRSAILYHVVPLTPNAIPPLAERNKDLYALKTASGDTLNLLGGVENEAQVVRENIGVVYCDELLATGLVLADRAQSPIFTYSIQRLLFAGPPLFGASMPERKRVLARVNSLLTLARLGDELIYESQQGWLVLFLPPEAALAGLRGISAVQLAETLRYHIVTLDAFNAADVACFTRNESFTMETAAGRKPLVYECKATTETAGRVYPDELNYIGQFAVRNAPNGILVVEVNRVLQPFVTVPTVLPPPLVAPLTPTPLIVPAILPPAPPPAVVVGAPSLLPPPPSVVEGEALRLMTQQAHAETVKVLGSKDKRSGADAIADLAKKIDAQGGARQLKRAGMTVGQWTDMHQQRVTALMRNGALDSVDKNELADALNALSDRF